MEMKAKISQGVHLILVVSWIWANVSSLQEIYLQVKNNKILKQNTEKSNKDKKLWIWINLSILLIVSLLKA